MLEIKHRFHGYNSLKTVHRKGLTVRSSQMSLKFDRRDQQRPYRVAVVVSRKVHKSAVVRNRIRRRIYEVIRRYPSGIPGGYDLVFMVYSDELATLKPAQLQELVAGLLQKALQ